MSINVLAGDWSRERLACPKRRNSRPHSAALNPPGNGSRSRAGVRISVGGGDKK